MSVSTSCSRPVSFSISPPDWGMTPAAALKSDGAISIAPFRAPRSTESISVREPVFGANALAPACAARTTHVGSRWEDTTTMTTSGAVARIDLTGRLQPAFSTQLNVHNNQVRARAMCRGNSLVDGCRGSDASEVVLTVQGKRQQLGERRVIVDDHHCGWSTGRQLRRGVQGSSSGHGSPKRSAVELSAIPPI